MYRFTFTWHWAGCTFLAQTLSKTVQHHRHTVVNFALCWSAAGKHKTEKKKKKKKNSLAAWHYFLSKNKYTVCRRISIYTKFTNTISSSVQCKNPKTWTRLNPEIHYLQSFFCLLFFFFFTSNFHCQSKRSSTASSRKHQASLCRLYTRGFPF